MTRLTRSYAAKENTMTDDQKMLSDLSRIRDLAVTIKNQPPSQRRHSADRIIKITTEARSRILEKKGEAPRQSYDPGRPGTFS